MKVRVAGDKKIAVVDLEGSATGLEHVAGDLVQVEEAGEEIVLIILAEAARSIAGQTAGCGRAEMRQNGHEIASPLVALDDVVHLAVDATVNRVNEAVAPADVRLLEESGGENPLTSRRESDVYRIVHPTRHHGLHQGVAGAAPEDVSCARNEGRLAGTRRGVVDRHQHPDPRPLE